MFKIIDRIKVCKDEPFIPYEIPQSEEPNYYYDPDELLFSRRKLIKDGVLQPKVKITHYKVAMYDLYGNLVKVQQGVSSFEPEYKASSIKNSATNNVLYKNHLFKLFDPDETDIPEEVDVPIVGIINEIPFASYAEMARYCGVSRQAAHIAMKRNSK